MPRSPTRVADKLGFESTTGHRNHLYLMYVLVLFVLVTVFVTIYGGLYKDLPERNFGDVNIDGKLEVDGNKYRKPILLPILNPGSNYSLDIETLRTDPVFIVTPKTTGKSLTLPPASHFKRHLREEGHSHHFTVVNQGTETITLGYDATDIVVVFGDEIAANTEESFTVVRDGDTIRAIQSYI